MGRLLLKDLFRSSPLERADIAFLTAWPDQDAETMRSG
jgi:hypothetical protein